MTVTELMVELQRLANAGEGGREVVVNDDRADNGYSLVTGVALFQDSFWAKIKYDPN